MTAQAPAAIPQAQTTRKVSVVIPTHNNLSLLLECLESLRVPVTARENTETVVVDNGSTDRTPHVLGERFHTSSCYGKRQTPASQRLDVWESLTEHVRSRGSWNRYLPLRFRCSTRG